MPDTNLEILRRQLDSELQSPSLIPLSSDFYAKLSAYSQKLHRSATTGASEVAVRLASIQARMIESMSRQLLTQRVRKAVQQNALSQLTPEERYVCSPRQSYQRRLDTFVEALSNGQPSFIEFAHRRETSRSVTIRFTKSVSELVGLDMRRYGPYEVDDVASVPATSADILIASGDAVEIFARDEI